MKAFSFWKSPSRRPFGRTIRNPSNDSHQRNCLPLLHRKPAICFYETARHSRGFDRIGKNRSKEKTRHFGPAGTRPMPCGKTVTAAGVHAVFCLNVTEQENSPPFGGICSR
jgi:hypothetical protein